MKKKTKDKVKKILHGLVVVVGFCILLSIINRIIGFGFVWSGIFLASSSMYPEPCPILDVGGMIENITVERDFNERKIGIIEKLVMPIERAYYLGCSFGEFAYPHNETIAKILSSLMPIAAIFIGLGEIHIFLRLMKWMNL